MRKYLVLFVLLLPAFSFAAGLRCGNKIVEIGDNFEQVLNTCGEADATFDMGNRVIYREVDRGEQALGVAESIKLDMWVYRPGHGSFSRHLHFENGILVKIELGDRG